ncbi:MAG: hypothetical protein ACYTKD_23180 [Planctomycetota bacterium]|jgi:hypothetical protein
MRGKQDGQVTFAFLAGGEAALAARRNGKKAETRRIRELTRDLDEL